MIIIHSMEGEVKIHIEDGDDYELTDDNGLDFWPTKEQMIQLHRECTP